MVVFLVNCSYGSAGRYNFHLVSGIDAKKSFPDPDAWRGEFNIVLYWDVNGSDPIAREVKTRLPL